MAYATVDDLQARWRTLTADEQSRATVLLEDAAGYLATQVDVVDGDEEQAYLLKAVSCNMVMRVLASADTFGVTQGSMTAGVYTQSTTYANPSGDMYLTKAEKKWLGIGGGARAGYASPLALEA